MHIYKIAVGFACGLAVFLSLQKLINEIPKCELYEKTSSLLFQPCEIQCDQVVDEDLLILLDIQSDLNRIEELSRIVLDEIEGSYSEMAESKPMRMKNFINRIEQLSTESIRDVSLLMITESE